MRIKGIIWFILLISPIVTQAQQISVTVSGTIKNKLSKEAIAYVSIQLWKTADSSFVTGTVSNEDGLFSLDEVKPGDYFIETSFVGYSSLKTPLFVGTTSAFLNMGTLWMEENQQELGEAVIKGKQEEVNGKLDKKSFEVEENISQSGGSVLQALQNLPGVSIEDGQVQLRGNSQVVILIDGKQTAITGFGNQNGLENIPASSIERIEIINNPSAKYDANGNAGIINIILKKEAKKGFNGQVGLTTGLGALWVRKQNLPGIRPQYQATPKINPTLSLNYRGKKTNVFLQADNLYTQTLNKNEFVTRTYSDGTRIDQQLKRNRNTNFFTVKTGVDILFNERNSLTISGMFSQESIKDYGDQPFFNGTSGESLRLWQFLEDEVMTASMGSFDYHHYFKQPGERLDLSFNYSFDRENEKYFFDNHMPTYTGKESFKLLADQKVADFKLDYTKPLKRGILETGIKFRHRLIPTNMQFFPGLNSPLDTNADGRATYKEIIPAAYGNYTYATKKLEAELGLRMEYVNLQYQVDPSHSTYSSAGYNYFQPFPNMRLSYNLNNQNKLSAFYNRRVDRPDEGDIRIFPKYDDAEIIKVGNPALKPQFTSSFELGYKIIMKKGYFYAALYHRISEGTITRIATKADSSNLIYSITQNAGRSYNTGAEGIWSQDLSAVWSTNVNVNIYSNVIEAFEVLLLYPKASTLQIERRQVISGNVKWNIMAHFTKSLNTQLTMIYLAPDIIPQGKIQARFSMNLGINKDIQKGKGQLFLNASDILNTLVIRKQINGADFYYTSSDYYETQVFRFGYKYKF